MRYLLRVALMLLAAAVCRGSITSQTDKTGPFTITTSPQTIAVGFPFQQNSDLVVLDEGSSTTPRDPAVVLTLGSDYTVTGGGYNGSNQMQVGSIVVVGTGAHLVITNDLLVIMRGVPINQTSTFMPSGPLTINLLEQMGDKLATLSQQVNEIGGRSLQIENYEFGNTVLQKNLRTGMVLGFDANGNVTYLPSTTVPGVFVSQLLAGSNVTLTPSGGTGVVTINSNGGTAAPGGSNTQIQYNNAGALGGAAGVTFAGGNLALTGTAAFSIAHTTNGGDVLEQLSNASTGTGATALTYLSNSSHTLISNITGTGYTGSAWTTGGPSGEAASIYTTGSVPLTLGTNSIAALLIDTSQAVTVSGWKHTAGPSPAIIQGPGGVQIQDNGGQLNLVANNSSMGVTLNAQSGGALLMKAASTTVASFAAAGSEVQGTTTNDSASAGFWGEYNQSTQGSPQSLSTNIAKDITSVSLQAGDYDVQGSVYYAYANTTTSSALSQWINTTSASSPGGTVQVSYYGVPVTAVVGTALSQLTPIVRVSLSTMTTVYLSCAATFGTSTLTGQGTLRWRRVR